MTMNNSLRIRIRHCHRHEAVPSWICVVVVVVVVISALSILSDFVTITAFQTTAPQLARSVHSHCSISSTINNNVNGRRPSFLPRCAPLAPLPPSPRLQSSSALSFTFADSLSNSHNDTNVLPLACIADEEGGKLVTAAHHNMVELDKKKTANSSPTKPAAFSSSPALFLPVMMMDQLPPRDDDSTAIVTTDQQQHTATDNVDDDNIWRARLLLIGAAALYGTNFSLVKLLGDTMPVGISTTLRFGLASLATLPFLVNGDLLGFSSKPSINTQQQQPRRTTSDIWRASWLGFEVGLWNSVGYVAQAVGLETTLASKSAFICSMAVVIVPLLDYMAGKRLLPRQWTGAVLALVGVAFLELGGGDGASAGMLGEPLITPGDALSLVQPIMFGIGFWRMEKAMHDFPDEAPRMTAAQLLAVFCSSLLYAVWTLMDGRDWNSLSTALSAFPMKEWLADPSILFSLFWTGCITTALTIYMETLALETLSAAETTLIFSTEPLWGTAFAALVMGEQLGVNAAFGAAFILSACLYSNLGMDGIKNLLKADNIKIHNTSWKLPSWLPSSLAGGLATWNVASKSLPTQELNDIVDDLMETLVDKLP